MEKTKATTMCQPFFIVTKYLRKINLKENRFILTQGFRGFSSCSVDSIVSGPVARQYIMVEGVTGKLLTSRQPGSRQKRRGRGQDIPFQHMPPVTSFLQLGPTACSFHCLPVVSSAMQLSLIHQIRVQVLMIQSLLKSPTTEHCCTGDHTFNTRVLHCRSKSQQITTKNNFKNRKVFKIRKVIVVTFHLMTETSFEKCSPFT